MIGFKPSRPRVIILVSTIVFESLHDVIHSRGCQDGCGVFDDRRSVHVLPGPHHPLLADHLRVVPLLRPLRLLRLHLLLHHRGSH